MHTWKYKEHKLKFIKNRVIQKPIKYLFTPFKNINKITIIEPISIRKSYYGFLMVSGKVQVYYGNGFGVVHTVTFEDAELDDYGYIIHKQSNYGD